jgi:hypothetical protein
VKLLNAMLLYNCYILLIRPSYFLDFDGYVYPKQDVSIRGK